jgi:hypothetical protein
VEHRPRGRGSGFPDLLHAGGGEQKITGVDVSGGHESTRLARAPTWIRPVHEATFVVHEAVQIAPCAAEALAEVLGVDRQQLRTDRIAHFQNLAKDVDQPLSATDERHWVEYE